MEHSNMASPLKKELKKTHAFASIEQEVHLNLLRTADQLQIQFERLFSVHGLTPAQYNVLRIVRGAGEPLPILEIASRTVTVVPGITGLIDRLEAKGFVRRERCVKDRRVIYVAISEMGKTLLARLDEPVLDLHRRLLGRLSHSELRTLNRLLEKCRS